MLLEILDHAIPDAALRQAAWDVCTGKGWYFGHGSHQENTVRFWKMDLEDQPAFQAIWDHLRPRCEALAGGPLRLLRVYANGHTYGLGGQIHADDTRPGTFTLLYYPMPEWRAEWEGETLFWQADAQGLAVHPQPHRAVFFDSRIPHAGRAPGRACGGLRVTVAYKLELAGPSTTADGPSPARIPAAEFAAAVDEELQRLGESVRLPGFRPGKIPPAVLLERYGAAARRQAAARLAERHVTRSTKPHHLLAHLHYAPPAPGHDFLVHTHWTDLTQIPEPDFTPLTFVELTPPADDEAARQACRQDLHRQVLDALAEAYPLPLAPGLIDQEYRRIAPPLPSLPAAEHAEVEAEFRRIAERRLRLGAVIAELARRWTIAVPAALPPAQHGAFVEAEVVRRLLAQARRTTRPATPEEWADLSDA